LNKNYLSCIINIISILIMFEENISLKTKYNIVLCSLYNTQLHGSSEKLDETLNYHYLNIYKFNYNSIRSDTSSYEEIKYQDFNYIRSIRNKNNKYFILMKRNYPLYYQIITKHQSIRNYKHIIEKKKIVQLEIAECIYLEDYMVCVIKTIWIRLIQRCWKKVFQLRKRMMLIRKTYLSLLFRERHGKWPKECLQLPGLCGLLTKKYIM